jgi:hypothetical protein
MVQINENKNQERFALRRSVQPYVGLLVIFGILMVTGAIVAIRINDWSGLETIVPSFCVFFGAIVFMGTRYRIYWDNGEIIQKAVAGNLTKIKVNEITNVIQETSDLQTLATFSRPMRRIAIYARHTDGGKFIDVSLKHFVLADVRTLMRTIHDRRPDLQIPKGWL